MAEGLRRAGVGSVSVAGAEAGETAAEAEETRPEVREIRRNSLASLGESDSLEGRGAAERLEAGELPGGCGAN